jgi:preprotein translocase subunit YajC
MWVILGGLVVVMFVMSRRNKKKQEDADSFRTDLAPGQRVMTMSGLIGVITGVEGDVITVASTGGDTSQWIRRAVRSLVSEEEWEAMTAEYSDEPEEEDAGDEEGDQDGTPDDDDGDSGVTRY